MVPGSYSSVHKSVVFQLAFLRNIMLPATSDIFAAFVSCLVFDIPATLCGLGLGIIGYLYFKQNEARNLPLPPGPKKLPIIGNAMNMPKSFEWVAYARWSEEYGQIFHVFGFHVH